MKILDKTLLLLGGSFQQCIAIEKAKALGIRTVLCDYLPDNPGRNLADVFYLQSTTDRDGVLAVAQKEKVDGILAYASDPAAPTAAYVAERMGLPTNPLKAVEILSFKNCFRVHLAAVGLPCPQTVSFAASLTLEAVQAKLQVLPFPFVMKPTDSSGSKGVTVVRQAADVPMALASAKQHSRNGILIAETYLEKEFPHVIGGDIFILDGRIAFDGLMSCIRDPKCALIPGGEIYPSGLRQDQKAAVLDVLSKLIASLGLRFGELNVEVILGPGNIPYVMELGARAGGNFIPLQLSDVSGIDLVQANVLCALGITPENIEFSGNEAVAATCVVHSAEAGIFRRLRIAPELLPSVYRKIMYKKEGDLVEVFNGANQALGILFLRFETVEQLQHFVRGKDELVRVEVEHHVNPLNNIGICRGGVSANDERFAVRLLCGGAGR